MSLLNEIESEEHQEWFKKTNKLSASRDVCEEISAITLCKRWTSAAMWTSDNWLTAPRHVSLTDMSRETGIGERGKPIGDEGRYLSQSSGTTLSKGHGEVDVFFGTWKCANLNKPIKKLVPRSPDGERERRFSVSGGGSVWGERTIRVLQRGLKVLALLEEEDQFSGVKSAAALCCLCKDSDDARSSWPSHFLLWCLPSLLLSSPSPGAVAGRWRRSSFGGAPSSLGTTWPFSGGGGGGQVHILWMNTDNAHCCQPADIIHEATRPLQLV